MSPSQICKFQKKKFMFGYWFGYQLLLLLFSLNVSDWRSLPNTSSAKPSKIIQHMESSAIPNCRSCLNSDTSGSNKLWVSSCFSIRAGSLILTSILSLTSVNGIIMIVSTRNIHPVITPCKWYQHLAINFKEIIYFIIHMR